MNDVTEDVPACTGAPVAAIPAPVAGGQPHHNYKSIARTPSARYPFGARPLPPEAERALAELEDALDLHGAPDPERTAAWLESEAEPAGAVLAVVPRG